jgi:hypothetical protein
MNKPHAIGNFPWSRDDMVKYLPEFLEIYNNRPIQDNQGGQKAAQLFYSWYVAKKMQPAIIIESGVYKGQGTWAFEQASPQSKIICLDPFLKNYQGYRSNTATYIENDFSKLDWSQMVDKSNVLCFFDDHQNAVARIVQCLASGFKYLMFEDNYPEGQGDCLSLKKAFENEKYQILPQLPAREYLERVIECYGEFPPIFSLDTTRWNTRWDQHRTDDPLLTEIGIGFEVLKSDMDQYTWINYLELK